jgi:hypothetical protein
LKIRTAPITGQLVTDKTTLAELFDAWIAAKIAEGDIAPQTEHGYRTVWQVHAQEQIGPLRIREFPTIRVREVPQGPQSPAPHGRRRPYRAAPASTGFSGTEFCV